MNQNNQGSDDIRIPGIVAAYESAISHRSANASSAAPGAKIESDLNRLREKMADMGFSPEEIDLVTNISMEDIKKTTVSLLDVYDTKIRDDKGNVVVFPVENPTICFVAGQPGCGKSNGIKAMAGQMGSAGKPFESEMDVYRNMHPKAKQIKDMIARKTSNKDEQGSLFVAMTAVWADMVELSVSSYLLSQGYNVIKETTGKNPKSIIGFIESVQAVNPKVEASVACMAVSQAVSINGTQTRGKTMTDLTAIFTEDLQARNQTVNPVGRGNVSEDFSKDCCEKIPGAMATLAQSGVLKQFIIATRGKIDKPVIDSYTGAEIAENAASIETQLADRITGKYSKKEAEAHFKKQASDRENAVEQARNSNYEDLVNEFIYPTITFLKENTEAASFYQEISGVQVPVNKSKEADYSFLAKWIVATRLLPNLKGVLDQVRSDEVVDTKAFDDADDLSNSKLTQAGEDYSIIITNLEVLAEQIKKQSEEAVAKQEEVSTGSR